MVETIKEEIDNFLLSCGFNKDMFYYPFPIEFLTDYEWKFIGENYIEVYDKNGYNIKHSFPNIYFDGCDDYCGIYEQHEKYIIFITSTSNNYINILTVLDKSLEIKE